MQIQFLGANHEVTGSRTLLSWDSFHALIDCGMEQGVNLYENAPMPVPASAIDFVFVTHAHIDHTGMLPKLYKDGFRGQVFATRETAHLMNIMLRDSAHIQMMEAEYASRKALRAHKPAVQPLYDLNDADGLMQLVSPCPYRETIRVADGCELVFTDIGHLLGSASITVKLTEGDTVKTIVFSGDVGNTHQPLIRDPQPLQRADYLMIESTYGDRDHAARIDPKPMMIDVIQRTLDRGGNVVIPSFAVGRTQEMLYLIREIKQEKLIRGHDDFPVVVDSPLANEATGIFAHCDVRCLDEEARALVEAGINPIEFPGLQHALTAEDSKKLNDDPTPKVILSASGMCDAGRIRHHLKYNLWRRESTILFTGYQAVGTLGRLLLDGAKEVKLFGDVIAVEAEIVALQGVSGHADRTGLLNWVAAFEVVPPHVFVNHGEDGPSAALAQQIRDHHGVQVDVPYSGAIFDLAAGSWVRITEGIAVPRKESASASPKDAEKALPESSRHADQPNADLVEAAEQLLKNARSARISSNKKRKRILSRVLELVRELRR